MTAGPAPLGEPANPGTRHPKESPGEDGSSPGQLAVHLVTRMICSEPGVMEVTRVRHVSSFAQYCGPISITLQSVDSMC